MSETTPSMDQILKKNLLLFLENMSKDSNLPIFAQIKDDLLHNTTRTLSTQEILYKIQSLVGSKVKTEEHQTTSLQLRGKETQIDTHIAPLIEAIWQSGIRTHNSCEDNIPKGYIWIAFLNEKDTIQFFNIIFQGESTSDERVERAFAAYPWTPNGWIYETEFIDDDGHEGRDDDDVDDDDEEKEDTPKYVHDVVTSYSVRFPRMDYPFVLNKFHKWNKQHGDKQKKH